MTDGEKEVMGITMLILKHYVYECIDLEERWDKEYTGISGLFISQKKWMIIKKDWSLFLKKLLTVSTALGNITTNYGPFRDMSILDLWTFATQTSVSFSAYVATRLDIVKNLCGEGAKPYPFRMYKADLDDANNLRKEFVNKLGELEDAYNDILGMSYALDCEREMRKNLGQSFMTIEEARYGGGLRHRTPEQIQAEQQPWGEQNSENASPAGGQKKNKVSFWNIVISGTFAKLTYDQSHLSVFVFQSILDLCPAVHPGSNDYALIAGASTFIAFALLFICFFVLNTLISHLFHK